MGRGAYDTTNPSLAKSSAAMEALRLNNIERAEQAKMDAEFQAAEDYAKLVKSKKSRGIVVGLLQLLLLLFLNLC
jgi:transaldolase